MKWFRTRLIFIAVSLLLVPFTVMADVEYDAESRLEEVMNLWSEGRYEELWDCGTNGTKAGVSREDFVWLMKRSPRVPDVGWMREKSITAVSVKPTRVLLQAEIGFIINGQDKRETRVFQMVYEDDEWRIMLDEFAGLARPLVYGY